MPSLKLEKLSRKISFILKRGWDHLTIATTSAFFSFYGITKKYQELNSNPNIHSNILDILIILVFIFVILIAGYSVIKRFYVYVKLPERTIKKYKHIFDSICEYIYKNSGLSSDERVSIFIIHPFSSNELLLIGRFSKYRNPKPIKITFEIGKGAAGITFQMGRSIYWEELPSYEDNPQAYIQKSVEEFNMDEKEVKSLGTKSRFFLSIPLYEEKKGIFGVILIDSRYPKIKDDVKEKIAETTENNEFLHIIAQDLYRNLKKEL